MAVEKLLFCPLTFPSLSQIREYSIILLMSRSSESWPTVHNVLLGRVYKRSTVNGITSLGP